MSDASNKTLGQVAYEGYFKSIGGVSGVSGQPLPVWQSDKVTTAIKAAWEDAAQAVLAASTAADVGKAA